MSQSIQQLENDLRAKEHERDSVSNAVTGATIGAAVTRGSALGMIAGAVLGKDQAKKEQLEREIADIKQKIQDTHNQISHLETKRSETMNTYQNNKAYFEADMRQKYTDLERQKLNATDPTIAASFDTQMIQVQSEQRQETVRREQAYQQEIDAIQREIDRLSF